MLLGMVGNRLAAVVAVTAWALAAPARAQDAPPKPEAPQTPPETTPAPAPPGQEPEDETEDDTTSVSTDDADPLAVFGTREIAFVGRVKDGGGALRSGADPNYREVKAVAAGTLLPVVGDRADFLEVLVPEGYRAFVHVRYVDLEGGGIGRVNASAVNVRAEPKTDSDYEIGQVDIGQELWVIGPAGEDENWLEIVAPAELPLWIHSDQVEVGGDLKDDATRTALEAALARRRADWLEHSPDAKARHEADSRESELAAAVEAALTLADEQHARGAAADYTDAKTKLGEVIAATKDPALKAKAESSLKDVVLFEELRDKEKQRAALRDELDDVKRKSDAAAKQAQVDEQKKKFGTDLPAVGGHGAVVGFMRLRSDDTVHPFALERGTRVACWLKCSSGRYRLKDFAGLQVEASGRFVEMGETPVIEVDRLVIQRR